MEEADMEVDDETEEDTTFEELTELWTTLETLDEALFSTVADDSSLWKLADFSLIVAFPICLVSWKNFIFMRKTGRFEKKSGLHT